MGITWSEWSPKFRAYINWQGVEGTNPRIHQVMKLRAATQGVRGVNGGRGGNLILVNSSLADWTALAIFPQLQPSVQKE